MSKRSAYGNLSLICFIIAIVAIAAWAVLS